MRPTDFLEVEDLLDESERAIGTTVRDYARAELAPHVADWWEAGDVPGDVMRGLGKLGVLGMHLEGYGCAGTSATAYGVACRELEAVDSGLRSLVSVQGSLAMFAIHQWGTEEHRQEWLPRMAAGEAVGCFGLTEADAGSDPGSMRTRARRDGGDWLLNGAKMWITNGTIADVAVVWAQTDDGIRGFAVPTDTPGFSAHPIHRKLSLRASVTAELVLDGVRLPESAAFPDVRGLKGPLTLPQRGPLRHPVGLGRRGAGLLRGGARLLPDARAVRQAARGVPAHPAQARGHVDRGHQRPPHRCPARTAQGRAPDHPRAGQPRQARQRPHRPRRRPHGAAACSAQPGSPSTTRSCGT